MAGSADVSMNYSHMFAGVKFVPVHPDHEHYPKAPNEFLTDGFKTVCYVRFDEWPALRKQLLEATIEAPGRPTHGLPAVSPARGVFGL